MRSRRDIIKNGAGAVLGMVLVSLGVGQAHGKTDDESVTFISEAEPEKIRYFDITDVEWTGSDGTRFRQRHQPTIRDSSDYVFSAFDPNDGFVIKVWHKEFSGQFIANVGNDNFEDILAYYRRAFEFGYYVGLDTSDSLW